MVVVISHGAHVLQLLTTLRLLAALERIRLVEEVLLAAQHMIVLLLSLIVAHTLHEVHSLVLDAPEHNRIFSSLLEQRPADVFLLLFSPELFVVLPLSVCLLLDYLSMGLGVALHLFEVIFHDQALLSQTLLFLFPLLVHIFL